MPDRQQSKGIDVRSIGSKAVNLKEENQKKKKCKKTRRFFLENGAYYFSRQRPSLKNTTTATTRAPISRVKRTSKAISFFFYVYIIVLVLSPFLQISFPFHFLFFRLRMRSLLSFFSFLFISRFVNGQPGRGSTFPTKQSDECATQLNR